MNAKPNHWLIITSLASLIAGTFLSHLNAPGVQVQPMTLAGDTPAIRVASTAPGPHSIALLAHGATGCKESLICYAEALAVAGFDCYTIDLPGHGESSHAFTFQETALKPAEIARTLGAVDVYLGHSMGAGAGGASVREASFRPRLFIALGACPRMADDGPPLLLLSGRFDEFQPPSHLKSRTDARLIVSPWSDHILELWDPCLMNAAVEAACTAVGRTPPSLPAAWLWRSAGLILAMAGAVVLALCLPELDPRLARARGFAFLVVPLAITLTAGNFVGVNPQLYRIAMQIPLTILMLLTLRAAGKFRIPRWTFPVLTTLAALVGLALSFGMLLLVMAVTTLLMIGGTVLGCLAARRGSRLDGDIAMAIFVGYTVGQWIPKFL